MAKRTGSTSKGKKNRKWGRNKVYCQRYRIEGRREKNKLIKLNRMLKSQPYNKDILRAINRIKQIKEDKLMGLVG